jgi:proteic killer suppression protein
VDIRFRSRKLERVCNEKASGQREWGQNRARKIGQRLMELRAAGNLLDLSRIPGTGFHPLHHDRQGQFAVSLGGNWRLVFLPLENPLPCLPDGSLDLENISGIKILEVVHYPGE